MLEKYQTEFEEMYQRVINRNEIPLKVIGDYMKIFEKEGIGSLGVINYLGEYSRRK